MNNPNPYRSISNKSERILDSLKNKDYLDSFKRTERVAAALFVVTDLFSLNNPIGHRIKNLGIALVTYTVSLLSRHNGDESLKDYAATLSEIVSLLEVSFLSGYISEMNYRVISSEIGSLISLSERMRGESFSLHPDADVESVIERNSENTYRSKNRALHSVMSEAFNYKGHPKGHYKGRDGRKKVISVSYKKPNSHKHVEPIVGKDERKTHILSILDSGRHLGVKDFLSAIPGISEKTIQRELSDLVSSGVLKREGERRWSRYFLEKSIKTAVGDTVENVTS